MQTGYFTLKHFLCSQSTQESKVDNTDLKFSKTERALLTCCLVFLAGFLMVTIFRTSFHSIDVAVNLWIPSIQSDAFTFLAKGIAVVFDTTSLVIISLLISGVLFLKNYKAQGLLLLAAMGGEALIVSALKIIEHVARPTNGIFLDTANFSYPSGHSAGVVVFAGVLAYFAWRHWQSMRSRSLIGVGLGAVVGIVGFDRLYLNVHWLSDVLGGWLLGAFWLSFAVLVFRRLQLAGKFESEKFGLVANWLYLGAVVVSVFVVLLNVFGSLLGI
jgi:membrane-associated phospholipid phosphatase